MKTLTQILALSFLLLLGCKKYVVNEKPIANPGTADMVVPDGFSYETTKNVEVNIQVSDLENRPLAYKSVRFYSKDPVDGGVLLGKGYTDPQGNLKSWLHVPTYLNEVFVQLGFVGFANNQTVGINNGKLNITFGGSQKANRQFASNASARWKSGNAKTRIGSSNFFLMSTYDANGVPANLEVPGDVVSTDLLNDINGALPNSGGDAPNVAASGATDATIVELSQVWVTFISEGAGFTNSLGFYVYDTDNPPASPNDIDSIFVIFPNASLLNSGGGLQAGDKVCLGIFPAGVSIGWVLLQNAFKNNQVLTDRTKLYSNNEWNPETVDSLRPHNVQLLDPNRQLVVVGFEDVNRQNPSCDNDFNDCIFYYTANPFTGLDKTGLYGLVPCDDSDNDGVDDCNDDYPNDPARVADTEYQGTLAYEDLWPHEGDYDFNDMVFDYTLTQTTNASNEVVDIFGTFTLKANGAGFNNGFGIQLDNVAPGDIASSSLSLNGNATGSQELGNTFATFLLFENAKVHMKPTSDFVNTVVGAPYVNPVTFDLSIGFSTPQPLGDIGFPPYNPFIYVNKPNEPVVRGREVHLPDLVPTSMVDHSYFGVGDDDTDIVTGKYYKTVTNLPWGLHIPGGGFDYPRETEDIRDAYLNFVNWAQSGGQQNADWYLDISGNRVSSRIYTPPVNP
ncbi:LruC domain-containing protein [Luteibaculum oceani]|nr:LruC domain-containing protein [Luteibaculum oceani]